MPPLVEALKITKHFGGITALNEASLVCQPGSIHALLGENGAGKSTLIKALAGVVTPDSGVINIEGMASTIHSPADAARQGIIPVFQELSLMPHLSVAENIFVFDPPRNFLGLISHRKLHQKTEQLFATLGFAHLDPTALVSELPLAQRQLVEIAKALSRNPKALILDEGTSALSRHDVELVFQVLRRLREEGRSVIFISHRMGEVEEIADTLTIFRDGEDVGSFPMGAISRDEIVQLMIGRKLEQVFPPKVKPTEPRTPVLEIKNLSWGSVLHDISLTVGEGEIVGLGGLDGQGQGELLMALFGILRGAHGQVWVKGKRRRIMSPSDAANVGVNIALIPEDRKTEGLILPMSVANNATLSIIDRLATFSLIDAKREKSAVQKVIDQMQVKLASERVPVRSLSGGNQQKVVIGKWLLTEASLYLLHDPTRGIDVGTKQEIYQLMQTLADNGAGILLFSTELSELVGLCDRVLVLYEGHIFCELQDGDITEENIISAALGLSKTPQALGETL
jgi:ribose transport system ATP-binding protein